MDLTVIAFMFQLTDLVLAAAALLLAITAIRQSRYLRNLE